MRPSRLTLAYFGLGLVCLARDSRAVPCPETMVKLVYANGMRTTEAAALFDAIALRDKVRKRLPGYRIKGALAYDPYVGGVDVLRQLAVAWAQREGDKWTMFWESVSEIDRAPQWFREAVLELETVPSGVNYVTDAALRRHVKLYRETISQGNPVLVVAHSQGNFYANAAHDMLTNASDAVPQRSLAVVGAATPSNRVSGNGGYVTLTNDLVISAIRLKYPDTLLGNVTNGDTSSEDALHHAFNGTYLSGDKSGPMLLERIVTSLEALDSPPINGATQTCTSGGAPNVGVGGTSIAGGQTESGGRASAAGGLSSKPIGGTGSSAGLAGAGSSATGGVVVQRGGTTGAGGVSGGTSPGPGGGSTSMGGVLGTATGGTTTPTGGRNAIGGTSSKGGSTACDCTDTTLVRSCSGLGIQRCSGCLWGACLTPEVAIYRFLHPAPDLAHLYSDSSVVPAGFTNDNLTAPVFHVFSSNVGFLTRLAICSRTASYDYVLTLEGGEEHTGLSKMGSGFTCQLKEWWVLNENEVRYPSYDAVPLCLRGLRSGDSDHLFTLNAAELTSLAPDDSGFRIWR